MLVYGPLVDCGMVFLGFDSDFQPRLAFFSDAMVCWDFYLGFELWFAE